MENDLMSTKLSHRWILMPAMFIHKSYKIIFNYKQSEIKTEIGS